MLFTKCRSYLLVRSLKKSLLFVSFCALGSNLVSLCFGRTVAKKRPLGLLTAGTARQVKFDTSAYATFGRGLRARGLTPRAAIRGAFLVSNQAYPDILWMDKIRRRFVGGLS